MEKRFSEQNVGACQRQARKNCETPEMVLADIASKQVKDKKPCCCSWQPVYATDAAKRFSVNVIGLFPKEEADEKAAALRERLRRQHVSVISFWPYGSRAEEIAAAGLADANIVLDKSGEKAAEIMKERFGQPYIIGDPLTDAALVETLRTKLK